MLDGIKLLQNIVSLVSLGTNIGRKIFQDAEAVKFTPVVTKPRWQRNVISFIRQTYVQLFVHNYGFKHNRDASDVVKLQIVHHDLILVSPE